MEGKKRVYWRNLSAPLKIGVAGGFILLLIWAIYLLVWLIAHLIMGAII